MSADPQMPLAPLTPLQARAAAEHELVTAWVEAGFTRPEAIDLLVATWGVPPCCPN